MARHFDPDYDDAVSEFRSRRRKKRYRCSDGMCGALDCTRCYGPDAGKEEEDTEEENEE